MDLDPTDEQKLLADTVDGLLDKRYDANTRLKLLESEDGWSREMWKQYAELGLLGCRSTSSTAAPAWASASSRW